jgi:hypothetical protein
MQATNGDSGGGTQEKAATNGGGDAQENEAAAGFTIGLGVKLQAPVPSNVCCRVRNFDCNRQWALNCSGGLYDEYRIWISFDVKVVPRSAGSVKGRALHKGIIQYTFAVQHSAAAAAAHGFRNAVWLGESARGGCYFFLWAPREGFPAGQLPLGIPAGVLICMSIGKTTVWNQGSAPLWDLDKLKASFLYDIAPINTHHFAQLTMAEVAQVMQDPSAAEGVFEATTGRAGFQTRFGQIDREEHPPGHPDSIWFEREAPYNVICQGGQDSCRKKFRSTARADDYADDYCDDAGDVSPLCCWYCGPMRRPRARAIHLAVDPDLLDPQPQISGRPIQYSRAPGPMLTFGDGNSPQCCNGGTSQRRTMGVRERYRLDRVLDHRTLTKGGSIARASIEMFKEARVAYPFPGAIKAARAALMTGVRLGAAPRAGLEERKAAAARASLGAPERLGAARLPFLPAEIWLAILKLSLAGHWAAP